MSLPPTVLFNLAQVLVLGHPASPGRYLQELPRWWRSSCPRAAAAAVPMTAPMVRSVRDMMNALCSVQNGYPFNSSASRHLNILYEIPPHLRRHPVPGSSGLAGVSVAVGEGCCSCSFKAQCASTARDEMRLPRTSDCTYMRHMQVHSSTESYCAVLAVQHLVTCSCLRGTGNVAVRGTFSGASLSLPPVT
jgi:hypothetical protein